MSRGLGKTQRAALAVLKAAEQTADHPRDAIVDSITVAARAVGRNTVTTSEAVTYRRALRTLAARGLAVGLDRYFRPNGRRKWGTPSAAKSYADRVGPYMSADVRARIDAAQPEAGGEPET